MNDYDVNACMNAFVKLCEESERSELVSSEECQYWVFERGYQAAMLGMANVLKVGQIEKNLVLALTTNTDTITMH